MDAESQGSSWNGHPKLFCWAGWSVALLLGLLMLIWGHRRIVSRFPVVQRAAWNQLVLDKQAQLASAPWKDTRPLNLLVGDSHIERGNWYELFDGAFAVRNCGLSRAKIQQVTALVRAVPDRKPESLILMCGFNNLADHDSIAQCIQEYEQLIQAGRSLRPRKLLVLSVMPLRQSLLDTTSTRINQSVFAFNQQLQELCRRQNAVFVNVTAALTHSSGGLADEFTEDGLHLNGPGYQRLAGVLNPLLRDTAQQPQLTPP